jgi:hypothetical protein
MRFGCVLLPADPDHRCRRHQPRICRARLLTPAALGPEHRRLLLRLADEQHSFGLVEPAQMLGGNIILALAFAKLHHRNLFLLCERLHGGHKPLADRVHEGTGNELVSLMKPEEPDDTCVPLQLWHVDVQIHPVDPLDLKADVVRQHLRHASWYAHLGSGTTPILRIDCRSAAYILRRELLAVLHCRPEP